MHGNVSLQILFRLTRYQTKASGNLINAKTYSRNLSEKGNAAQDVECQSNIRQNKNGSVTQSTREFQHQRGWWVRKIGRGEGEEISVVSAEVEWGAVYHKRKTRIVIIIRITFISFKLRYTCAMLTSFV